MFDQHDDGSHEITLHNIRCPGCEQFPKTSGKLLWAPNTGLRCSLSFEGIFSLAGSPYDKGPPRITAGVGRLSVLDLTQPRWIAETDDGTEVLLYGVSDEPNSVSSYGTSGSSVSCGFSGNAMYAVVNIPTRRRLAFDKSTEEEYRFFFIGHVGKRFHAQEPVSFRDDDGEIQTVRCSINLSQSPRIRLVSSAFVNCRPGGWLTCEKAPPASDCDMPPEAEQAFISFLNADKIPVPWADRRVAPGIMRRTYYGWVKSRQSDHREPVYQPLPFLGGIEVFSHGEEVLSHLPAFFQRFVAICETFDFIIGLHPLWTALHGVLDDRLALASVSLERIASLWEECRDQLLNDPAPATSVWKNKALLRALRTTLLTGLNGFVASDKCRELDEQQIAELYEVMTARLNNLTGTPNSARLRQPFDDLQIPLSPEELKAIQQRNSALHGHRQDGAPDLSQQELSTEYFDRLRMLVTKVVLKLCDYEGPYIDYASRPTTGNFEIKRLAT